MTPNAGTVRSSTEQVGGFNMTRDELVAKALEAGWNVTGYRWVRLTRPSWERIEVWFVDGRATVAKYTNLQGTRRVNITQHRHPEIRANLAGIVATWTQGYPPEIADGGLLVTIPTGLPPHQEALES